jgi:Flp pilus assembly protein TadD
MTTMPHTSPNSLENLQVDALLARGFQAHRHGNLDTAEACYRMALEKESESGQALYLLGLARADRANWSQAESLIHRALKHIPEDASVLSNLAAAQLAQDKARTAEETLLHALTLMPGHVECLVSLGIALRKQGRPLDALEPLHEALTKVPDHSRARGTLANVLEDLTHRALASRNVTSASTYLSELEKFRPDHTKTLLLKGNFCLASGELAAAEKYYRQVLRVCPEEPDAYSNLGSVLAARLDLEGAMTSFNRALSIRPNHPEYRFNRSLIHLIRGEFEKGWIGYDQRRLPNGSTAEGAWLQSTPDNIKGKRVLVYTEQGFGDSLQFARYLPMLKAAGAHVFLVCQPELRALFESSFQLDGYQDNCCGVWDVRISLLSLPRFFATDVSSIPALVPYLFPPRKRILTSTDMADDKSLKIGVFWQGRKMHGSRYNRRRCSPQDFYDLGNLPGVKCYSLQKEEEEGDQKCDPLIVDLAPGLGDFADTAAAIAQLDLIISVDTAVAHLAGAMGKPVWTLLPYSPDWRWLLGCEDSPWYPTMRLWRQPSPGDWNSIFTKIKGAVCQITKNGTL